MQIDLKTVNIQPQRQTFDHLVRRFGDKPASRYQEGSYDIQPVENLHYVPTWDPDQQLYDASITRIVMKDWYAFKDPRQFYYTTYTLARAKQQDTTEANFSFIEDHGLFNNMSPGLRKKAIEILVPLRHVAYGANQNNTLICGYGYGTTFTQPMMYHAMDNLGIAQYISRLGLLLGDVEALETGKKAWLNDPAWQPLRRLVEDMMVVRDPFELFVAQNVTLDGLLYPLVYQRVVVGEFSASNTGIALGTQFQRDWYEETAKWIDSVLKIAGTESEDNRVVMKGWIDHYRARAAEAMVPVLELALGQKQAQAEVQSQVVAFNARIAKTGIVV